MSRVVRFLRSPAFLFTAGLIAASYAARQVPSPWDDLLRRLNSWIVLFVILWLAFQARVYRNELRTHLAEISAVLKARDGELQELKATAQALAIETARFTADVTQETKAASKMAGEKMSELKTEIRKSADASRAAETAANDVNAKIENLNERLIERVGQMDKKD